MLGPSQRLLPGVQVQIGVFPELALRAGMDLAAVVALTDPKVHAGSSQQQELITLAALERVAPRALAQQAGAMLGLSPIVRRAQVAARLASPQKGGTTELVAGSLCAGPADQANQGVLGHTGTAGGADSPTRGAGERQPGGVGLGGPGQGSSPTYRGVVSGEDLSESSAMGAARGERRVREASDVRLARQIRRGEEEALEERAAATSRDAELAMLPVAEEARERGIDREAALRAQGGAGGRPPQVGDDGRGTGKGKEKANEAEPGKVERALGWERRLSEGAWRGAADLAPVTLQPSRCGGGGVACPHPCLSLLRGRTTPCEHHGQSRVQGHSRLGGQHLQGRAGYVIPRVGGAGTGAAGWGQLLFNGRYFPQSAAGAHCRRHGCRGA